MENIQGLWCLDKCKLEGLTRDVFNVIVSNVLNTDTLTEREKRQLARRQQLRDLYDAGATVEEIAEVLEITRQGVYQMLKTLNLPAPTKRDEKAS